MTEIDRTLRLDLRLIRRRGWIDSEELERQLAALPDASGKGVRGDPEGDSPEADPEPGRRGA